MSEIETAQESDAVPMGLDDVEVYGTIGADAATAMLGARAAYNRALDALPRQGGGYGLAPESQRGPRA